MKVKSLALTVAVLGAITATAWYLQRDSDSGPVQDARIDQPLLDSATVARIGSVVLTSGGNSVTLAGVDPAKVKAGVVKEYYELPGDYNKLARHIEDLLKPEARITRLVGTRAERIEKLGFAGENITFLDREGQPFWTLHLGGSPERGGRFVKFGNEDKAYLSGLSTWLDVSPRSWADSALVGAKADDVVGIEVFLPGGGSLAVNRVDGRGVWKCPGLAEGESLKDSEWNSLAGKLAGLRFMDTREPESLETIAGRPTVRRFNITLLDGRSFSITTSQRQDPPPVHTTQVAEGDTPPTPQAPPADVWVSSSRTDDPVNAIMLRRGFQIAEWTFNGLSNTREALVNPAPASAPEASAPAAPNSEAPASESAGP